MLKRRHLLLGEGNPFTLFFLLGGGVAFFREGHGLGLQMLLTAEGQREGEFISEKKERGITMLFTKHLVKKKKETLHLLEGG